ncbi:MAG TPA: HEAT repeat domain-containing protein [Terriglobales bacterium]|nr:HEAT repeat domain-containing protein [Terriglobales bacterium]
MGDSVLEQKQLKPVGLRYARTLQIAVRTAIMLGVEHPVTSGPIQQSFDQLILILKQTRELVIGFVDDRLMLNNLLTKESGVAHLENEFLKRGIGAVRFEPGLTLARYRQVVGVLSTAPKLIAAQGGPRVFLEQNAIDGIQFFPTSKDKKRTEEGDTILESDAATYLRTHDVKESLPAVAMEAMGLLFESAGLVRPPGVGGPDDIMNLIGPTLQTALTQQHGDPYKAYTALARLLQGMKPDLVLSAFPPERRAELSAMPPDELATELIADTALTWASQRLSTAPKSADAYVVEEDVVRVLARSLYATQMAEKLAAKLARFVREYSFPQQTYEKIQDELRWVALPPDRKQARLLETRRYSRTEFLRLMDHLKERIAKGRIDDAVALANHYLGILGMPADEVQPEELSRLTELINLVAGPGAEFAQTATERLIPEVQGTTFQGFKHFQLVNALAALAQTASLYENYEQVQRIGLVLEKLIAQDLETHSGCCGRILPRLLLPPQIERIIEIYLQKRDDSAWAQSAAIMLRRTGSGGLELVFHRLENEKQGGNRLALLRLLGRAGQTGIEVARRRLADERWYVVRNACVVLSELRDPELLPQLAPALRHPDERVQQAAVTAILKSRLAGRGQVLAGALGALGGHVLETALDELMFLKDPAMLADLEKFIFSAGSARTSVLQSAIQVVAAIEGERSSEILVRVLADSNLAGPIRRMAGVALGRRQSEHTRSLMEQAASGPHADDLLAEYLRAAESKK